MRITVFLLLLLATPLGNAGEPQPPFGLPPLASAGAELGPLGDTSPFPVGYSDGGGNLPEPVGIYRLNLPTFMGQSPLEIVRAVRPALIEYSKRTGLEACARLCKTNTGVILARLVTTQSHLFCVATTASCLSGETAMDEHVHSHPPQRAFCVNEADWLALGKTGKVGDCHFAGHADSFSPEDRKAAPAYLVTGSGALLYTDGKREVQLRP